MMTNGNQEPLLPPSGIVDAAGEAVRAATPPATVATHDDIRPRTPAPETSEVLSWAMRFQGAACGLILYFPVSLLAFMFFAGMTSGAIGGKKVTVSDFKTAFVMFSIIEFMGICLGFNSPTEFRNNIHSYFCYRKPQENTDEPPSTVAIEIQREDTGSTTSLDTIPQTM
jgi:hypothetical protein